MISTTKFKFQSRNLLIKTSFALKSFFNPENKKQGKMFLNYLSSSFLVFLLQSTVVVVRKIWFSQSISSDSWIGKVSLLSHYFSLLMLRRIDKSSEMNRRLNTAAWMDAFWFIAVSSALQDQMENVDQSLGCVSNQIKAFLLCALEWAKEPLETLCNWPKKWSVACTFDTEKNVTHGCAKLIDGLHRSNDFLVINASFIDSHSAVIVCPRQDTKFIIIFIYCPRSWMWSSYRETRERREARSGNVYLWD